MSFSATIWRQHPQAVTRYLYLDQPTSIFSGQCTGDANYPLSEFTYGSTSGSASAVEIGMLVLFGSAAGLDDLGRGWIRKLPDTGSSTMYVNRSPFGTHDGESNIAVGSYFTVLDTYPLYARHPYIDPLTNIVYKDYDLDWPSYGAHLRPVVNIEGGICGVFFDDGSGFASVTLDATTSFAPTPGDTITAWQMSIADGTLVSGSLTSNFAVVKFPVGSPISRRWVIVQATTSAGQVTRRHYLIIVAPTDGHGLLTQFEISSHSLEVMGTKITFQVRVDIPLGTYIDSMIGCYVEKETFGTTHGSMGGPSGKEHIKFSGWFQKNTNDIKTDTTGIHKDTRLEFLDGLGRLALLPSFTQLVERRGSAASTWQQMVAPDIDQYLAMLWLMHSTAPFVCDFHVSGHGSSYPFTVLGSDATNLFEQIDKRAKAIQHLLVCDPWGRVYVRGNPQRMITAAQAADSTYAGIPERNQTVIVTLAESDMGDVQWTEERPPRQHWLRGGAIQAGTDDASNASRIHPFLNIAPGSAPGQGVSEAQDDQSLAINQIEINAVVGHAYAQANLPILDLAIPLLHFNSAENFAPSLLSWIEFPNSRLTSRRKRFFGSIRFLPTKIEITHNMTAGTKVVKMTVQEEAIGTPAETEIIPVDPTIPVDSAFTIPEYAFPLKVPSPPTPTLNLKKGQTHLLAFGDDGYMYLTTNFGSGSSTHWTRVLLIGPYTLPSKILNVFADPWSPLFQGTGSAINVWVLYTTGGTNQSYVTYINDILGSPSASYNLHVQDTGDQRTNVMDFGFAFRNYGVIAEGGQIRLTSDGVNWPFYATDSNAGGDGIRKFPFGAYMSNHKRRAYMNTLKTQNNSGVKPVGVVAAEAPIPGWTSPFQLSDPGSDGPLIDPYFDNVGDLHLPYNNNSNDMIAYYGSTGFPMWPKDTTAKPYDWKQVFDFTTSDWSDYWSPDTTVISGGGTPAVYASGTGYQQGTGHPVNGAGATVALRVTSSFYTNLAAVQSAMGRTFSVDKIVVEGQTVGDPIHDTGFSYIGGNGPRNASGRAFNIGAGNFFPGDAQIIVNGSFVATYMSSTSTGTNDTQVGVYINDTGATITVTKITLYGYGPNPFRYYGSLSSSNQRLLIRTLNGETLEDVSPQYGGENYGPWKSKQIISSLVNRNLMVAAAGVLDQSLAGIWTSINAGKTWRNLVIPIGPSSGRYEQAVISYDGKNQLFLMGSKGYIGLSTDWVHVKSQTGDLLTNFPSIGTLIALIGHAP